MKNIATTICLLLLSTASQAVSLGMATKNTNLFYGGGLGLSLGNDYSYIELSPMLGIHLTPKISSGVSLMYRHTSDKRNSIDRSADDYGATLFGRYRLSSQIFLEGDLEHLNYERFFTDGSSERTNFDSVLAGGGFSSAVGSNASFTISMLYNFSYNEADSPYTDPLIVRAGFGVGF